VIKKMVGVILSLIGAALLVSVVATIIRTGAVNLIGTVVISAAGLAAMLLGVKMIREKKASGEDEQ